MLLSSAETGAVPAFRGLQKCVQPDGTVIEFRKIGDEKNHILLGADGTLLEWNGNRLEYARYDESGKVVPTGVLARNSAMLTPAEESSRIRINDEGRAIFSMRAPRQLAGRGTSSFPAVGDANVLVVLVEYSDVKFNLEDPYAYYNGMLNEEGFSQWGGTGSAKEYFRDNSKDQFRPHFDVFGPVTLPETMKYYGENDFMGSDKRAYKMVTDAAELLDDTVDFSRYDMDGDGYVDNVFVIYAGQGEATFGGPDTVWPHSYDLIKSGEAARHDGKLLNHYACCNEWLNDRPDGVGTFIHEFSHVIGLPDLYSTDGRLNATPSSWSVLDYGPYNNKGCTPPNYSVFERVAMGWLDPKEVSGTMNLRLEEIGSSNDGAVIRLEGKENEYFLIENRQQTGWDKYLPGHGMLVWHIDYNWTDWMMNQVNNDPDHQRVDIIEAGVKTDMDNAQILAQYPWPGTLGKTELGFGTTPSLQDWSGKSTGVELSDIEESADGVILARVNGGLYTLETPAITAMEDKGGAFTAFWTPVENAIAYELEVTALYDGEAGTDFNNMGTGSRLSMPEGWTSGSSKTYTTSGNYGKGAPSYKMETDGDWILSPEYPADITDLSFWMKGSQTSSSTIDLTGLVNGEWVLIESFEPVHNKALTCRPEMPQGVRQVKLQYNMVKGKVAVDDIDITYGRLSHPLEGYFPLMVELSSSASVDCSSTDARRFQARVRALSTDDRSRWSEYSTVQIEGSGVKQTSAASHLRLEGNFAVSAEGSPVRVYDVAGRKVSEGVGKAELPVKGLFIVVSEGAALKVSR